METPAVHEPHIIGVVEDNPGFTTGHGGRVEFPDAHAKRVSHAPEIVGARLQRRVQLQGQFKIVVAHHFGPHWDTGMTLATCHFYCLADRNVTAAGPARDADPAGRPQRPEAELFPKIGHFRLQLLVLVGRSCANALRQKFGSASIERIDRCEDVMAASQTASHDDRQQNLSLASTQSSPDGILGEQLPRRALTLRSATATDPPQQQDQDHQRRYRGQDESVS